MREVMGLTVHMGNVEAISVSEERRYEHTGTRPHVGQVSTGAVSYWWTRR